MKLIIGIIMCAITSFAQQPKSSAQGERQQTVILAETQSPHTVAITLNSDAATVWESYRLSTPGERDTHGVSAPQFKSVDDLINFTITQVTKQLIQRFPTPTIQAAQLAQSAAAKAVADATDKAVNDKAK